MKNLLYSLFIILLTCYSTAHSQSKETAFSHIETKEGLSQSNILCIQQDKHGFMWFGTWDGLNKYDGYKITVFKKKPGIAKALATTLSIALQIAKILIYGLAQTAAAYAASITTKTTLPGIIIIRKIQTAFPMI